MEPFLHDLADYETGRIVEATGITSCSDTAHLPNAPDRCRIIAPHSLVEHHGPVTIYRPTPLDHARLQAREGVLQLAMPLDPAVEDGALVERRRARLLHGRMSGGDTAAA